MGQVERTQDAKRGRISGIPILSVITKEGGQPRTKRMVRKGKAAKGQESFYKEEKRRSCSVPHEDQQVKGKGNGIVGGGEKRYSTFPQEGNMVCRQVTTGSQ